MTVADQLFERPGLRLRWAAATDVGKVRRLNEDAYLAVGGMFVVADGMGGHAAGDVASTLTVDACRDWADSVPVALADLERLVDDANQRVRHQAETAGTEGMGTTLVAVVLVDNGGDDGLAVVNVGDSRCYAWDADGGLTRLTHDHSVVQELVDAGAITSADADHHPERNVVTRAIGIEPAVAADFVVLPRSARQRLLLCSDGVSGPIGDERLSMILAADRDATTTVDSLIEEVLSGAAADNATAIVVDVEWAQAAMAVDVDGDEVITGPRPAPPSSSSAELIDTVPLGEPVPAPVLPEANETFTSEVPS